MPKPYPRGFPDDVARVARQRGPGVRPQSVTADFATHAMTLSKWMRQATVDSGGKTGALSAVHENSNPHSSSATPSAAGGVASIEGEIVTRTSSRHRYAIGPSDLITSAWVLRSLMAEASTA